jgi:hypothetical protein
LKKIVNAK